MKLPEGQNHRNAVQPINSLLDNDGRLLFYVLPLLPSLVGKGNSRTLQSSGLFIDRITHSRHHACCSEHCFIAFFCHRHKGQHENLNRKKNIFFHLEDHSSGKCSSLHVKIRHKDLNILIT